MSSDKEYYSTLDDLEEFAKLLSPTSAQLREATVADSTRQFEFPDLLEEESLGIDIRVHADSNMSTDSLWIPTPSLMLISQRVK